MLPLPAWTTEISGKIENCLFIHNVIASGAVNLDRNWLQSRKELYYRCTKYLTLNDTGYGPLCDGNPIGYFLELQLAPVL